MARYYRTVYREAVSHPGLNKYRVVTGHSRAEVMQKVSALSAQWEAEWQKKCELQSKREQRERKIQNDNDALAIAKEATQKAEQLQNTLDRILLNSLNNNTFDFEKLKDKTPFQVPAPQIPKSPDMPREPLRTDEVFNPRPQFLTRLSKSKKTAFDAENQRSFEQAHQQWEGQVRSLTANFEKAQEEYALNFDAWKKAKEDYEAEQAENNAEIDTFARNVSEYKKEAIEHYFSLVLGEVSYPFGYSREVETEYNPESKMLIVDLVLPTIECLPNLKSITYVKSRTEFKKATFPESYMKKKYDSVIYQIVLQTLHLCFNNPVAGGAIDSVALNGIVKTIDKATGNKIEPCILSLTVGKEDFLSLNLSAVDPKAWFKSAKGVSAASLANIAPVAPLVEMSKEDKRFIEAYEVADTLDEGTNLAAMDWQDFENLIRELFEKEFSVNGGEVKITQASRDGGVDAVAFDPDPIRGGKIVIQAKRYTNVVGVSAVRDLYGTVMNEGATKGILVTTSSYGNDAYKFANGKPLTLLNGANLLYLMQKHGYHAKIDIKEAKEMLKP